MNDTASPTDPFAALIPLLPTLSQLALTYAPACARMQTLALLALDTRLAGLLRHSREPMLAQLRLSWWRETLRQDCDAWPSGDPLLTALQSWNGGHGVLVALVDGWEALTGPAPLGSEAIEAMAKGRGEGFRALAVTLGHTEHGEAAARLGCEWALADLALHLSHPQERAATKALLDAQGGRPSGLPRVLRPLLVLNGLAVAQEKRLEAGGNMATVSPGMLLRALRQGLFGR